MAAEYITKSYENSKKEIVTKQYRVDADFVPTSVDTICDKFIENYCVANNQIDWLVETVSKKTTSKRKIKDAEGNVTGHKEVEVNYTFANIRSDFVTKFFPQILKGDKGNKPLSFAEQIKAKYAK
jgi:hypothetical protein